MNCFSNIQVAESIIEEFSDESTFEQLLELEFGIIEGQLSKLQDDRFVSMDIICKEFKDERILWRIFYGLNKTVGSGKLHQSDLRGAENSWKSWNGLESIEVSCKEAQG